MEGNTSELVPTTVDFIDMDVVLLNFIGIGDVLSHLTTLAGLQSEPFVNFCKNNTILYFEALQKKIIPISGAEKRRQTMRHAALS